MSMETSMNNETSEKSEENLLTTSNYESHYFNFMERQAGISLIYSPKNKIFTYNVYCMDKKTLKELYTVEVEFLTDALDLVNSEFSNWELLPFEEKKDGCSSCAAK